MSLISFGFERFFNALQYLPPQSILGRRHEIHAAEEGQTESQILANTRRNARKIDVYVSGWVAVAAVASILVLANILQAGGVITWVIWILAALRIIDILQVAVNVSVFDRLRVPGRHRVASLVRTFVLSIVNYFELLTWFALVYATRPDLLNVRPPASASFADSLYFSVVTQLTVGYGDILPSGMGRLIAGIQALVGFFFSLIILGRVVALLPRLEPVLHDDE